MSNWLRTRVLLVSQSVFRSGWGGASTRLVPGLWQSKRTLLLLFCIFPASTAKGESQTSKMFQHRVQPLLQEYCFDCHGRDKQEADLRLDHIAPEFGRRDMADRWAEILDRLTKGEMPPADEPQPGEDEVSRIVEWIGGSLKEASANGRADGRMVMRRLNRAEYNNTIRDLVGIDFEPATSFPVDPPAHGFDNVGAALRLSPLLMEKYVEAAREIIDRAIVTGPPPVNHVWHMEIDQARRDSNPTFDGGKELWVTDPVTYRHSYIWCGHGREVRDGFLVHCGVDYPCGFRWFKIPETGKYVVRVRAAGLVPSREQVIQSVKDTVLKRKEEDDDQWRNAEPAVRRQLQAEWLENEWPAMRRHFETEPIYEYGPPRMKVTNHRGEVIGTVSVEATIDSPQIYEFLHEFERSGRDETETIGISNDYQIPRLLENSWLQRDTDFARPELLIDWVEFEGIYVDQWPPESHQRILVPRRTGEDESRYVRRILRRFMRRAWRRPVTDSELDAVVSLFTKVRPSKPTLAEALKTPLVAVLSSPHFLFLVEPRPTQETRLLNSHELASRLSYFLWSSMPDDELFALAEQGKLVTDAELDRQVDRMLGDSRAKQFVGNFVGQWLGLRDIDANPPVENLYPRYDQHLKHSMVKEAETFFWEILQNDLNALQLIQSDFVTINQRLARFYGIDGVRGDHFRRVSVPPDIHRGGILTQAGVLTITSNGTRTSPVVRGAWILENVLGAPTPPPPPDAGDLAPKVPGIDKATVRDRLEAHRRLPQCATCHDKIDPLGFALENFDAHGRWRTHYGFGYQGRVGDNDPRVNASGRLPDGREIDGVRDLQQRLLEDHDQFLSCMTEKLMIFALGRGLAFSDRVERDRLVANLKHNGYHLRLLIKEIVRSDLFRTH